MNLLVICTNSDETITYTRESYFMLAASDHDGETNENERPRHHHHRRHLRDTVCGTKCDYACLNLTSGQVVRENGPLLYVFFIDNGNGTETNADNPVQRRPREALSDQTLSHDDKLDQDNGNKYFKIYGIYNFHYFI